MAQATHRIVYFFDETTRLYLTDGRILFNSPTPNNALDFKPTQFKPKEENGVWIESATTEDISELMKQQEFSKYLKRIEDGKLEYMKISAEFRTAKRLGQLDEATHSVIEDTLKPVRNEVLAGQWIDAKKELEKIDPLSIGQSLYDRLHLQISDYITINYD